MEQLKTLFADKSLKPKDLTTQLSQLVLEGQVNSDELMDFASKAKDPVRATCIEALEFATIEHPEVLTTSAFEQVLNGLGAKAPRIRWEAAKVTANVIHQFPGKVEEAATLLLANSTSSGTVVRWSAATALSKILLLQTKLNATLVPALENIAQMEEKNSIKKIYAAAMKNLGSLK